MKKLTILMIMLIASTTMAQKTKIKSGDFIFLKDVKEINVVFNYDNLKLLKNNISEEQYVRERKADLNNKTNGNGEIWEQKWESAKDEIWKARFLELLKNTATSEKNILFKENLDTAEYTLIVEVVWIYPGWGSGWIDKMAEVTTILKIVETATPSNVLLEVESKKAIGEHGGDDYSNESRIGGGFATTAKTFGKMIVSKTK